MFFRPCHLTVINLIKSSYSLQNSILFKDDIIKYGLWISYVISFLGDVIIINQNTKLAICDNKKKLHSHSWVTGVQITSSLHVTCSIFSIILEQSLDKFPSRLFKILKGLNNIDCSDSMSFIVILKIIFICI